MRVGTLALPRHPGRLLALGVALGLALAFVLQGLLPPAAAQEGEQAAGDWPQLQHDVKHTGHNSNLTTFSGPFSYTPKWKRDLGVALAHRAQPVIADGVLVVGGVDGRVFFLSEATGLNSATPYQTGGPIAYTAALDGGRAYVVSQDGYLYALNLANGGLVWRVKSGRRPAGGAPVVYNSRVYVAGKDGYLRAFNTSDGSLAWTYDTANTTPAALRAPILSTPAIAPAKGVIFFAAENLRAYAVNLADGSPKWSYQMYGESAGDSWPVVSETANVVVFRTKSVYSFHSSLGLDDGDLFCPGDQNTACGSCASLNPDNYNAPAGANTVDASDTAQWNEQHYVDGDNTIESIDEIFLKYPQRRTFYALNIDSGVHLPAPILWTGGGGRVGIMPVVNEATGDFYVFARTKYSRRDTGYFCRKWVDLVRVTFDQANQRGTFNFLSCPSGFGVLCPDAFSFHFIGDETTALSMAGNLMVGTSWYHTGSVRVDNGALFDVSNSSAGPQGTTGSGSDHAAPAAIANGVIFVKARANPQASPDAPEFTDASLPVTAVAAYRPAP